MDTGSYMANQIDCLIENGLHQMDEFMEDLSNRINKYIKDSRYSWTVEEIIEEYREKYTQGFYVSFTGRDIIENFEEDLIKATGLLMKTKI